MVMASHEKLTIWDGDLTATIDPNGAWLQTFTSGSRPILFHRQSVTAPDGSQKVRGGSHVCLPNFGPGGDSGLKQHGFGRDEPWEVSYKDGRRAVVLEHRKSEGDYADLVSRLRYAVGNNSLLMELSLHNFGESELRVAPGFHPYFMAEPTDPVSINGVLQNRAELNPAIMLEEQPTHVQIGSTALTLYSENLPKWVAWTDQLGEYVCLEPTFAGASFEHPVDPTELLAPGKSSSYALSIAIS